MRESLSTLAAREQRLLELRFGAERTLEEMGQGLAVTRERVRQIEAKALGKLRGERALREICAT